MDALVIGLVGLGGLYTIANQNKKKKREKILIYKQERMKNLLLFLFKIMMYLKM